SLAAAPRGRPRHGVRDAGNPATGRSARRSEARDHPRPGDRGRCRLSGGRASDHRGERSEDGRGVGRGRNRRGGDSPVMTREVDMPKAYWIAHIDVSNPEGYKAYVAANAE